jgi:transcriptional regulator with XRE-family HTH domain
MPRPTRPENRENPLRKLREDLEMSQLELSKTLGVSKETIFSIENGRLNNGIPTPRVLDLIRDHIGVNWSAEQGRWEAYPGIPFTPKTYELRKRAEFNRIHEADALANGLISLLLKVSDEEFASLSDAIYRELYRLAHVYGISIEYIPGIPFVDEEFRRMDMAIVNIWRDGKNTKNPEDVVGLRRERGFLSARDGRELLDFRYRNTQAKPVRSKPSSRPRLSQIEEDGAPKTSSPRIP